MISTSLRNPVQDRTNPGPTLKKTEVGHVTTFTLYKGVRRRDYFLPTDGWGKSLLLP